MFKILLMYSTWGFNFIKTVYEPLVHVSNINANPHLPCTILERDMMTIFPNCVNNVRIHAFSDSVKSSRKCWTL